MITQNVMCACNFDMKFTFVCSGWEGSANDLRVFEKAITSDKHMFSWPTAGSRITLFNIFCPTITLFLLHGYLF